MKNLILFILILGSLNMFAQRQDPIAMNVVVTGAFDVNNPCGEYVGAVGKYIRENIHADGKYNININGQIYAVIVDVVTDNNTHIIFAETQCGKKNYTNNSKNYLDAVGGKIWSFVNEPNIERFAQCNNIIASKKTFTTQIITDVRIEKEIEYVQVPVSVPSQPIVNNPQTTQFDDCERAVAAWDAAQVAYDHDNRIFKRKSEAKAKFAQLQAQFPYCLANKTPVWKNLGTKVAVVAGAVTAAYVIGNEHGKSKSKTVYIERENQTEVWGHDGSGPEGNSGNENNGHTGSGNDDWGHGKQSNSSAPKLGTPAYYKTMNTVSTKKSSLVGRL
jgi:hypothetical protein